MKNKAKLDALVAGAVEAEADPNRHVMEEAILATVARHGLEAQALWHGFADLAWSRTDFAAIASALWDGIVEGVKADPVVIRGKLKDGVRVENAVLTGILDGSKVKDVSIAEAYIRIMDKQDRFHRAADAGREYLDTVEKAKAEGGDVDAAVAGLLKDTFSLAHGKKLVKEYQVEADGIPDFMKALEHRRADGRDFQGRDCGFNHLNEVLNGLTEGLFILAGAPSCGKTTLAKQIADHVAAVEKVPVLFWSFEQSQEELRIKSLARLASVNSRGIWKGRSDADTWAKVEQAAEVYPRVWSLADNHRSRPGRHAGPYPGRRGHGKAQGRGQADPVGPGLSSNHPSREGRAGRHPGKDRLAPVGTSPPVAGPEVACPGHIIRKPRRLCWERPPYPGRPEGIRGH